MLVSRFGLIATVSMVVFIILAGVVHRPDCAGSPRPVEISEVGQGPQGEGGAAYVT